MFKPIEGGSQLQIGEEGLEITVHLPPVGYVWNWEENKLERSEVICRSIEKSEQFWERPARPAHYERKAIREREQQKIDPEYIDAELQSYRAREWHRRKFGVWFLNNGVPTYLTGGYYFYLAHWTLDVGAPKFKIADLHKSYFWKYCQEDPCCYGMLEMTKRRVGKTYYGSAAGYEIISRTSNAHMGIQSKTSRDAQGVFQEKLIQPWRKLIDFFRPKYDTSGGDVPKTSLRFFQAAGKGKNIESIYDATLELESYVDFASSDAIAYDGQKMIFYFCDEVFKTTETNIIKRHEVIKPCLEDESGNIIGKTIYTSTVEDMEGYLELYLELWNKSDINDKNANGKTKSGLYRWFTSSQAIMHVDKYGHPDRERALREIQNEIDGKQDDPRAQAAYIRKNPRTWKECFRTGADNCLYNVQKIEDRITALGLAPRQYERYDLIWDDKVPEGEIPRVRLVRKANGRFRFAWQFSDQKQANDVQRRGSSFYPKNSLRFVMGVDPFDHNRTKSGTFSSGAGAVYMKYDALDTELSENFVAIYVSRPPTAAIFYEDMVKLCHYFSCPMLFEDNKPNIENYFIERGYGAFLVRDAKGHAGISATTKSHESLAEHTNSFIEDNVHKVVFPELIEDWKSFDLDDTTKSDLAMASGYALIAAAKMKSREKLLSKIKPVNTSQFIRKYKLRKKHVNISKSLR